MQPGPAYSVHGRAAVQRNKEERLEAFRRLTRDKGMKIRAACDQLGVSYDAGSRYERTLTERTGLTRQQHLLARWRELVDQGHTRTQAAAQIGIQLQRLRVWEKDGLQRRRTVTRPASLMEEGRAAVQKNREDRLEAFRRLTREERLTRREACKRLGISTSTGSVYERELIRRTGLTRREHWLKVWRELRAVTPRAAAADLLGLSYWGAADWDRDCGIPSSDVCPLTPDQRRGDR